jgi:hypothetical protein
MAGKQIFFGCEFVRCRKGRQIRIAEAALYGDGFDGFAADWAGLLVAIHD